MCRGYHCVSYSFQNFSKLILLTKAAIGAKWCLWKNYGGSVETEMLNYYLWILKNTGEPQILPIVFFLSIASSDINCGILWWSTFKHYTVGIKFVLFSCIRVTLTRGTLNIETIFVTLKIEIDIGYNRTVSTALLHRWNSTVKTPKLCPMSP